MGRRDSHLVEQAEPHRSRSLGVMAGGTSCAERRGRLSGEHRVNRRHRAPARVNRRVEAVRRRDRVGVELTASGLGQLPHPSDVGGVVHAGDRLHRGGWSILGLPAGFGYSSQHGVIPGGSVGVRTGIVQAKNVVQIGPRVSSL